MDSPSVKTPEQYIALAITFMNLQSRGSVTLQSTDPSDTPLVDPNFLHEAFDRRVAIEAVREAMAFLETPSLKKDQVRMAAAPESMSDVDILVRRACFKFCFEPSSLCHRSLLCQVYETNPLIHFPPVGFRPQNRSKHVALLWYRSHGSTRFAQYLRRHQLSRSRTARATGSGYERRPVFAEVGLANVARP